jgi:hypothetical protein
MTMRLNTLAFFTALALGLAAAPALYAHESGKPGGSMMGPGMMGGDMMNMMGQMGQMMDHCNKMMQGATDDHGSGKPNDQWRKDTPTTPEGNR